MISIYGSISGNGRGQKPGWFSVRLDDDVSLYYRSFSYRKWNLPMNGCHITFIAGEKECRMISLEDMKGYTRDIEIIFDPVVMTNGESFWIDCQAPQLDKIRDDLGLGNSFRGKYHITLGNFKNLRQMS